MKLKKGQINQILFPMVDATDFATLEAVAATGIDVQLYGVDQGTSNAASTITVTNAVTSVTADKIYKIALQTDECGMDHYMLRLSAAGCALQLIPLEMEDVTNSEVYSLVSNVDSQLTLTAAAVDSTLSTLNSHIVIASDFMSNVLSRVPKEIASKSLLSDVESNVRSLVVVADAAIDAVQVAVDSQYSDLLSTMGSQFAVTSNYLSNASNYLSSISAISSDAHSAAAAGGASASAVADKVWSDYESKVGASPSQVYSQLQSQIVVVDTEVGAIQVAVDSQYSDLLSTVGSQFAALSDAVSNVQSTLDSHILIASDYYSDLASKITAGGGGATPSAIASKVWSDYASKVGDDASQVYSQLQSQIAAGGGGATPSAIAAQVWSDYESRVGASPSQVYSQVQSQLTVIDTVVDGIQVAVDSQYSDLLSTMGSQFAVASNYLSNASNYLSNISVIVSDAHSAALAGGGGATASAVADKVWSDYESKVGASPSQVYSQVQSQLTVIDTEVGAIQTAVDSQYSDLLSTVGSQFAVTSNYLSNASNYLSNISVIVSDAHSAALVGGVTASAMATKVWSDYESKVGASPSQVYSQLQSQLSDVGLKVTSAESALSNQLSAAQSSIESKVSDIESAVDVVLTKLPNRPTKNTALGNFQFLLVNSTDHVTPETGVSVTAERSIDGGAFAACFNSVAELAAGIYTIDLATTDMNGDVITLKFTGANADTRFVTIVTQTS